MTGCAILKRMSKPIALAVLLEGLPVERVVGSAERAVTAPAPIGEATETAFTFCSKPGEAGLDLMRRTRARVVLCAPGHDLATMDTAGKTFVIVADPRLAFLRIVGRLFTPPVPAGIHPTAVIEQGSTVHPAASIGAFAFVGTDCAIGEGTVIHGHVHIYPRTRIGRNVTIHSGTVIGADGFGYQRNEKGELEKFPHIGGVVIEDGVEIGSNTSIDRGTLSDTTIREGARIDNLVHIAHNVVVGRHAAVIAHAMIGGSTIIGDGAWIAPSACLRDGLRIGNGATVGLGAVVVKDVADGETVMGAPARPAAQQKAILAALGRLAEHD